MPENPAEAAPTPRICRAWESGPLLFGLFILLLSLVSIADMVISNFSTYIVYDAMALEVVTITDSLLTVVFLFDFSYRISTTSSKSTYFFKNWGWADLLACVPLLRIFRVFRIVRAARLMRTFGLNQMRLPQPAPVPGTNA